jgi:hypothetical protein
VAEYLGVLVYGNMSIGWLVAWSLLVGYLGVLVNGNMSIGWLVAQILSWLGN